MNEIRNCPIKFGKVCPKSWDALRETDDQAVRHCDACREDVFFCSSDADAIAHAQKGHCIAMPVPKSARHGPTMMRRPKLPLAPLSAKEAAALAAYQKEESKSHALRDIKYASRHCPDCGYPVSDWLPTCRVCGFKIGRFNSST